MTTVIVGGGWSGLAAAVTLCQHGHPVHLLESAKQLGGRARSVLWQNIWIDNGPHLMIGAYQHLLDMMALLNIDLDRVFHRQPFDLIIYAQDASPLHIRAQSTYLPWPLSLAWHILNHAGVQTLRQILTLQHSIRRTLAETDKPVSAWLHATGQSPRLIKQFWEPLCLATLNTPIQEASAHIFATVLRDSLGQGKKKADLLFPRVPLGDLFPQAAQRYIQQKKGNVSLRTRVTSLHVDNMQCTGVMTQSGSLIPADHVILATPPRQTVQLLSPYYTLPQPEEYPITTVYLHYPPTLTLDAPMIGMTDTVSQWVFDRSDLMPGLLAVVISGPGEHLTQSRSQLIATVSDELHTFFPVLPAQPLQGLVIREKRATFAATVHGAAQRPTHHSSVANIWLAGDHVANGYPATLEGAIRNGIRCAHAILSQDAASTT